jgi:hypothetical protein
MAYLRARVKRGDSGSLGIPVMDIPVRKKIPIMPKKAF